MLPEDFSSRVMAAIEDEQHHRAAKGKALFNTLYCFIGVISVALVLFAFNKFNLVSLHNLYYHGVAAATSTAVEVMSAFSSSFDFFVDNKIFLIILLCMAALGTIGQIMLKPKHSTKK